MDKSRYNTNISRRSTETLYRSVGD